MQKSLYCHRIYGSVVFARWRQCSPLCNTCFLGPIQVHNPNSISTRSAIFVLYSSRQSAIGHDRHLFPLKNCPSHGAVPPQNCPFPCGIWTPSNASFLEPTRVHNSNGISISSAVFAELRTATDPTDRQTGHATRMVTICHIYVRSTAMPPKNSSFLLHLVCDAPSVKTSGCNEIFSSN